MEAFLECFYNRSKSIWISCMSVSLLVGLLPYWNYTNLGISPALDEISFWNFWRHSWDVGTQFLDYSGFHVCLSVCLFAYFLTKIRQKDISSYWWDIFLKLLWGKSSVLSPSDFFRKFQKDISSRSGDIPMSNLCKEVSQQTDWQIYKIYRIIWN